MHRRLLCRLSTTSQGLCLLSVSRSPGRLSSYGPSATIPNGSLHLSCLLLHFPRLTVIPSLARSRARHYSPTYQPARHSRVPPGLLESPHSPMSPRAPPRVPEPTLLACQPTRVPLATARKPTCRPAASLMAVPHSCLSPLATNQPALAYTRLLSPTLACHRARVSRHSRVPACHGHASHASACIHMHRMHPHVSTCPTRVPSVRPPSRHEASENQVLPHPVAKLPGSNNPSGPHAIGPSE